MLVRIFGNLIKVNKFIFQYCVVFLIIAYFPKLVLLYLIRISKAICYFVMLVYISFISIRRR
jgi:hypothetical protein